MSQVDHRKRLRERRPPHELNLDQFVPVGVVDLYRPVATKKRAPASVQQQRAVFAQKDEVVREVTSVDPQQVALTVATLSAMTSDDYHTTMAHLQASAPEFYRAVVEHLSAGPDETIPVDDGYDLSQLAVGRPDDEEEELVPGKSPYQLAAEIAVLPPDEYKEELTALQLADPELYKRVSQELVNMQNSEAE